MKINIIGAGKVGKTLGRLFTKLEGIDIVGVYNRSIEKAEEAVNFIGSGIACCKLSNLPKSDISFITLPDEKIAEIAVELRIILPSKIYAHCSGILPASILNCLKVGDCKIAAVHPALSFAIPELSSKNFRGTFCALDGDVDACNTLADLFERIGGKILPINSEQKVLYHAACVFASNYCVTLENSAEECLVKAGVDKDLALQATLKLMQSAIDNIKQNKSAKNALTGPIQRGSITAINAHLEALKNIEMVELYKALGKETLKLATPTKELELLFY